jgi:dsRNA-specific ribonuclease
MSIDRWAQGIWRATESNDHLARAARESGLTAILSDVRPKRTDITAGIWSVATSLEAVIGAVFLDLGNKDLALVDRVMIRLHVIPPVLIGFIETSSKNPLRRTRRDIRSYTSMTPLEVVVEEKT